MAKTSDGPLRSGELARVSGVSADALRVYERRGLLPKPPRSSAGYRFYPREAVRRVQLIRGALSLGFSLEEMGELLTERDRGGALQEGASACAGKAGEDRRGPANFAGAEKDPRGCDRRVGQEDRVESG